MSNPRPSCWGLVDPAAGLFTAILGVVNKSHIALVCHLYYGFFTQSLLSAMARGLKALTIFHPSLLMWRVARDGNTFEGGAFYSLIFMLLPVNDSSRNCWSFFIFYCICINLFKMLSVWDWCAFILVPISPCYINQCLLTLICFLVRFSQERIFWRNKEKKKLYSQD